MKQELSGTKIGKNPSETEKAYEETLVDEKSVVSRLCNDVALMFSVIVKEQQDKLPTMYWLPKHQKRPYKAKRIANSCACTITELSKLLTFALLLSKFMCLGTVKKFTNGQEKFILINKNSTEVLDK